MKHLKTHGFPIERLWELYDFNPLTGCLISTQHNWAGRPIKGRFANSRKKLEVVLKCEDGSSIATNYGRVVYAWVHGKWPEQTIDHIDRDPTNNRVWNLRDFSQQLQTQNTRTFNYGTSWKPRDRKWSANILINRTRRYLGYFDSEKEAQEAYMKASNEAGLPYLEPALVDGRYIPAERLPA